MTSWPWVIAAVGLTLHGLLLMRILWHRQWGVFPYFCGYLLAITARNTWILFYQAGGDTRSFSFWYWSTQAWVAGARTLVLWEVLRHLFPLHHPLRSLVLLACAITGVPLLAFFSMAGPDLNVYAEWTRRFALSTGAWMAVITGLAMYYGRPLTRQVWAMAAGMGLFATVALLNFVAIEALHPFEPWTLVRQFDFVTLMAIWLWGFWKAPLTPAPSPITTSVLLTWRQYWTSIRGTIRRAVGQ